MREGFFIQLSDDSDISIIPDSYSKECSISLGSFAIKINGSEQLFEIEHDQATPRSAQVFIKSLKKRAFEDAPEKPAGCSCGPKAVEAGDDVGTLGCRVSNCCCNCGGGWIC